MGMVKLHSCQNRRFLSAMLTEYEMAGKHENGAKVG